MNKGSINLFSFFSRLGILFFFLFSVSSVFSVEIHVTINESVSVTKLLSGSYSLDVNGILTLHNPSLTSKVYEYSLPLSLDSLVGISKVTGPLFDNDRFDFSYERINGYLLQPNETITIGYHIYGLLTDNLISKLNGESALEYYSDFEFSSNTILNLQKPIREDQRLNDSGEFTLNSTNTSSRLVTAGIRNPTDFTYVAKELKIYSSDTSDPMFSTSNVLTTFYNITIDPFGYVERDFFDRNSSDSSVYWMSSSVLILPFIDRTVVTSYTQETSSGGGGGSSSGSFGGGFFGGGSSLKDAVLIKKSVDRSVVNTGDEFKVFLTIVNVKNMKIKNLTVLDELPEGYEIKDVSDELKLSNGKLEFHIDSLDNYEAKVISYTLVNKKDISGITYLKPAELRYDNYQYFSEGVLVIHDLLPDKKVFVQKKIDIVDEQFQRVTIKVKNLGSIPIEDLLVTDIIDPDAIIKDLSQLPFERGSWKINRLLPGGEWEVSYLIERAYSSDSLPNVYGVDKKNVYGTLISSEEIITVFQDQPRTIEKIGMYMSIGLLIFYLLF
jgi:uncharacterized membrane protein YgcG